MSGAYAHMTIAGLLSSSNALDRVQGFPTAAKISILDYTNFCELGTVSPDYPYLHVIDSKAGQWADLMHYQDLDEVIICGVESLRGLGDKDRPRSFAWFLGLIAHFVTDMVVHPVVQLKVGPYEQNKTKHRTCEMHQDAYIFPRLNVGNVGTSDYLDSGIATCSDHSHRSKLNQSVCNVWDGVLQKCYPVQHQNNTPQIDGWHASFIKIVSVAEKGPRLFALARHVTVGTGLTYPQPNKIDMQYIANLKTPTGTMHYDDIFKHAQNSVLRMWALIAAAVYENSDEYKKFIGKWNLDSGTDANNKLVFWS